MSSKIFLLLGLSFAFVLLISSEVAARDLAEASSTSIGNTDAGHDQWGGHGGHGGGHGGHGGHGGGHGGHGGHGGGHGGGGGCHHGYCGHGCCRYAGEAETEAQPHN